MRVLVVDDDVSLLDVFVTLLEADDYEVVSVASAEAAERILAQCAFDAVLCDLQLPGKSGLEFLRSARHFYPELPVVLITGFGTVEICATSTARRSQRFCDEADACR